MNTRSLVSLSAAAILAVSPAALAAGHSATSALRSAGDPIAQSVILRGHLRTSTRLALRYVVAGNTAVYSSSTTGEPILADGGELGSIRVFINGKLRGGSDAGAVTCAADTKVREYYDQFPTQSFRVKASNTHRVRVVAHYCAPDGTQSKSTKRIVVR
ncbi:exported hypothetical protein [metagenome]|uniref:Uncharacterized protein n=1 Tax=metagenome TaxID=256318 RepID=A0A2P2BWT0_9ZZZZ